MTERLSVLMPAFNREELIGKAIKSVLDQTHEEFELILYDDGSTDNTREVMLKVADEDDRIKVITCDENNGVGYARNKLLDACKYPYACWQDSDDISHSDRFKKQLQFMCPFSLVFTKWRWFIDDKDGFLTRDSKYSVDRATPTLMFPVDKSIRFDESMRFGGEDWNWIDRMRKSYQHENEIDEVLYFLRFHNDRIGIVKRQMIAGEEQLSYKQVVERIKES